MAKYISLENLETFLTCLQSKNYEASSTKYGAIKINNDTDDTSNSTERSVKLDGSGYAYIDMGKASTSNFGAVKVTSGNGLAIDNGVLDMGTASDSNFGAVKVTSENGLTINGGVISMGVAHGNNYGAVKVTTGNGLAINDDGVISMSYASGNNIGAVRIGQNSGLQVAAGGTVSLLPATYTQIGGVKVTSGNGLTVSNDGAISLGSASYTSAGAVQIREGGGLDITNEGILSLGSATGTQIGGVAVMQGRGLVIDNGQISMGSASYTSAGAVQIGAEGGLDINNGVLSLGSATGTQIGGVAVMQENGLTISNGVLGMGKASESKFGTVKAATNNYSVSTIKYRATPSTGATPTIKDGWDSPYIVETDNSGKMFVNLPSPIKEVTYEELVELKNSNALVPGTKYRIINYSTIGTTKMRTPKSNIYIDFDHNPYDIIVEAITSNSLSEDATADFRKNFEYKSFGCYKTSPTEEDTSLSSSASSAGASKTINISDWYNIQETKNSLSKGAVLKVIFTENEYYKGQSAPYVNIHVGIRTLSGLILDNTNAESLTENGEVVTYLYVPHKYVYQELEIYFEKDGGYSSRIGVRADICSGSAFVCSFTNSDIGKWKLKYSLEDNSPSSYAPYALLSGIDNHKGVVYYMKDEYNNECPYDFKNIKFRSTSNDVNVPLELRGQSNYYYTFNLLIAPSDYGVTSGGTRFIADGTLAPSNSSGRYVFSGNAIKPNSISEFGYGNFFFTTGRVTYLTNYPSLISRFDSNTIHGCKIGYNCNNIFVAPVTVSNYADANSITGISVPADTNILRVDQFTILNSLNNAVANTTRVNSHTDYHLSKYHNRERVSSSWSSAILTILPKSMDDLVMGTNLCYERVLLASGFRGFAIGTADGYTDNELLQKILYSPSPLPTNLESGFPVELTIKSYGEPQEGAGQGRFIHYISWREYQPA